MASDAASIAAGKQVFEKNCANCHGKTGVGDGMMGSELNPKPSNLTDADWKHGSNDGEIFTVIKDGGVTYVNVTNGNGAIFITPAGVAASLTISAFTIGAPGVFTLGVDAGGFVKFAINPSATPVKQTYDVGGSPVTLDVPAGPFVRVEVVKASVTIGAETAVLKGDYASALKIQDRLVPLHDAVFKEPGLAGAKHGLKLLGRIHEEVRLPLMPVTPPTGKVIRDAMVHAGLIN